jgi:hypothetical protein
MKRRSKAGGGMIKGRRRKAPVPKRRNGPKVQAGSNSLRTQEETEVARLTSELNEAREQQTATSEVLKVISSFAGELEPVFQTILVNATRICEAKFADLLFYDGGPFRIAASIHGAPRGWAALRRREPIVRPPKDDPLSRLAATKQLQHVADMRTEKSYIERDGPIVALVETAGARTIVLVPMLKDDELIGAIATYRREVQPFTDEQVNLLQNFAAQAVIAIENARLLNELRQRTNDLTEALEQQTATSEVLQVISSSQGALEPVFAAMLASATLICEAKFGNLFLREGETFRAVAWHGEPTYVDNWRREPLIIKSDDPHIPLARLVERKQRVHIADLRQEAAYKAGFAPLTTLVDRGGARTLLIVPMLKEHTLVGAIAHLPSGSSSFRRQADRARRELRRPSCHRHRKRAVAQRIA